MSYSKCIKYVSNCNANGASSEGWEMESKVINDILV